MAGSNRRIVMLGGLLVVLVLVIVLIRDPFGWLGRQQAQQREAEESAVTLVDLTAADLTKFTIKQPDADAFSLVREGETWYVEKPGVEQRYKINLERVDKLMQEIPGMKAGSVASESKERHETLEVDEAKGIRFEIYGSAAEPAVTLIVGKPAEGYQSSFVRRDGEDTVYRSATNIKSLIAFSFEDFRTKRPWEFKPELVESVGIRRPETGSPLITFTRQDGFWKLADGSNGNQNVINEMLDELSRFTISEFVDDPAEADSAATPAAAAEGEEAPAAAEPAAPAGPPLLTREPNIVVRTPTDELKLILGDMKDSMYYLADGDGFVYQASEYSLKFYRELDFDKLTFDDTAETEPSVPDEGVAESGLPSDAEEEGTGE